MMRRFLLVCCVVIGFRTSFATPTEASLTAEQVSSIALYCKVWGFLKYYHTAVASGAVGSWDKVFLEHYDKIRNGTRADCLVGLLEISKFADSKRDHWKENKSVLPFDSTAVVVRPDFSWLSDTSLLGEELSKELTDVRQKFYPVANKYCGGSSDLNDPNTSIDNKYSDFSDDAFPEEQLRILALARYWNIIAYFYPYHKFASRPWDSALAEGVYRLIHTSTALEYHLAMQQIRHELNDGNTSLGSEVLDDYVGDGYLPFILTTLSSRAVITGFYGSKNEQWKKILSNLGISKGDVLVAINGKSVSNLKELYAHYLNGANEQSLDVKINNRLLRGKLGETVQLTISNGDREFTVLTVYQDELLPSRGRTSSMKDPGSIIGGAIGYLDLSRLQREDVKRALEAMKKTKAIIIDLRNNVRYHIGFLSTYFIPTLPYAYAIRCVVNRPGYFVHNRKEPLQTGGERPEQYTGQVIILVNENTQGNGELYAMGFQTIPGAITIGSQTAGSVSQSTEIVLPGKIKARFPYEGFFYLDGRPVQREGVKIDIPMKPSIPGVNENRDEVLERAIQYINTGK